MTHILNILCVHEAEEAPIWVYLASTKELLFYKALDLEGTKSSKKMEGFLSLKNPIPLRTTTHPWKKVMKCL